MAHFAKIGINSKVIGVHAVDDKDLLNADGVEDESVGKQFLERIHGWPLWVQTSYNTRGGKHYKEDNTLSDDQSKAFRKNYAGIGFTWDEDNNIFWPKKPFASWVKHISSASWKSPLGDAPALTTEQQDQNTAGTHSWTYEWDEDAYQADNTTGWSLTNLLA